MTISKLSERKVSGPVPRPDDSSPGKLVYVLGAIVIAITALAYWPVIHGNFVWDDWQSFHDTPWLTQGDNWKHYIFRDFNFWHYYFRPFGLALFTLQVRAFDSSPGPMHAASLLIHLINIALVGKLSWDCASLAGHGPKARQWATALCMALYGLHAALIESVAWIGCQFDLVLTTLVLLGLIANMQVQSKAIRATVIALVFFLAACTKESAISFPILLLLFDWLLVNRAQHGAMTALIGAMLRRNWATYGGILAGGAAYLVFRHWALGSLTNGIEGFSISAFAHVQLTSYIYYHYWKIILWPIDGMGPIHPFDIDAFSTPSPASLAMTAFTLGLFFFGLYLCLKRASALGCIIVAVTAALLPVLQIIPGHFERSLYHERYATTALAVLCAMLPLLRAPPQLRAPAIGRMAVPASLIAIFLWLSFSIVDIRLIVPKWSNDVELWKWSMTNHPQSPQAKSYLLLAYIRNKDFDAATAYADRLMADPVECASCLFTIAQVALSNGDLQRATRAMNGLTHARMLKEDRAALQTYDQLAGELLLREGKLDDAEKMVRASLVLNAKDPKSQQLLAEIEASRKKATAPSH